MTKLVYRTLFKTCTSVLVASSFFNLTGCGNGTGPGSGGSASSGPVEDAFIKAAGDYGLPERYLITVAYNESGISPQKSTVPYVNSSSSTTKVELGFNMAETAFGLSRATLGITNTPDADTLPVQIDAYGKWLQTQITAQGITSATLPAAPQNLTDELHWLWQLAQFHREGDNQKRNIRIFFVRDLVAILNKGITWQDPSTGNVLNLAPEDTPIDLDNTDDPNFPNDMRTLLTLDDSVAQITNARQYGLVKEPDTTLTNSPTHVEVIHCPFNLSACLELQDTDQEPSVALGAHYIIPQDQTIFDNPIQVAQHEIVVKLTNSEGQITAVQDAVIIMLAGESGRYVDGIRYDANPAWFTQWQLERLSAVIDDVCTVLAQKNSHVSEKDCRDPSNANGVQFQVQGDRATYRWGDIPDFDKSIFWTQIGAADGSLEGEVSLTYQAGTNTFVAGSDINFSAAFQPGAQWITVERAVRCADNTLVWDDLRSDPVRDTTTSNFDIDIWDGGPNADGHQFLKVLVYAQDQSLMGWIVGDLFITGFDPTLHPPAANCFATTSN